MVYPSSRCSSSLFPCNHVWSHWLDCQWILPTAALQPGSLVPMEYYWWNPSLDLNEKFGVLRGRRGTLILVWQMGMQEIRGAVITLLWGKEWGFWIRCPLQRNILDQSVRQRMECRWLFGLIRASGALGRTAEARGEEVQAFSFPGTGSTEMRKKPISIGNRNR